MPVLWHCLPRDRLCLCVTKTRSRVLISRTTESPTVPLPWTDGGKEQAITCETPGGTSCSDNWGLDFLDQEYDHSAPNPPQKPDNKYRFSLSSADSVRIYIVDTGIPESALGAQGTGPQKPGPARSEHHQEAPGAGAL